ncbi:ankyrin repeat protein, partial [Glonium stellatum]
MVAVREERPESVKLLLERGADVELQDETPECQTCLHQAASTGSSQYIRMLAQSGANVNCRDNNEYTPLLLASEVGHLDAVQLLLQLGADVDAVCDAGNSSLFFASLEGKVEIVELL